MPGENAPDHLLVSPEPDPYQRLADRGPRYKETPLDPAAVPPGQLAEPYNTATAAIFILIVVVWAVRLRGRYRKYVFVTAMLPVLLAGGIGGTLYHAFRSQIAWFLLDVIPIQILGLAAAGYLVVHLARAQGWVRIGLIMISVLIASLVLGTVIFTSFPGKNPNLRVNLSYLSLSVIVMGPIFLFLLRTRFAQFGWVLAALTSFGIAWFCRLLDGDPRLELPMGSHWLWHLFGALCTQFLFEYFYRIRPLVANDKYTTD